MKRNTINGLMLMVMLCGSAFASRSSTFPQKKVTKSELLKRINAKKKPELLGEQDRPKVSKE